MTSFVGPQPGLATQIDSQFAARSETDALSAEKRAGSDIRELKRVSHDRLVSDGDSRREIEHVTDALLEYDFVTECVPLAKLLRTERFFSWAHAPVCSQIATGRLFEVTYEDDVSLPVRSNLSPTG